MYPKNTVIRKDYVHDLEKHAHLLNEKAHIKPKKNNIFFSFDINL